MILVFEMICIATGHAATNSAVIQTICGGFPDQPVRVLAHDSHIRELQSDPILLRHNNVSFRAVAISRHYMYRPHIVSLRRGLREFWTLLRAVHNVPAREHCLIMLISATPTAIFAASLLARLMLRRIAVQVCLHGNLNDAFGWRTRNPLARMIDLRAALDSRHGGRLRLLVLEDAIRRALVRLAPAAAPIVDVLPHPISSVEVRGAEPKRLALPLRIGLLGQATKSKGITPFLAIAHAFKQAHTDAVSFHLVGNAPKDTDLTKFAGTGRTSTHGARFARRIPGEATAAALRLPASAAELLLVVRQRRADGCGGLAAADHRDPRADNRGSVRPFRRRWRVVRRRGRGSRRHCAAGA